MNKKVYIDDSTIKNAGRGIFAAKAIKKNETIEVCPILIIEANEEADIMNTDLGHYVFEYNEHSSMLALGYGSLYNHSVTPNAHYELSDGAALPGGYGELYIIASKSIKRDEEIYINYGPYFDELFGPQKKAE